MKKNSKDVWDENQESQSEFYRASVEQLNKTNWPTLIVAIGTMLTGIASIINSIGS